MIEISIKVDTSWFDRIMSDFHERMAAARARTLKAIGQQVASRTTQAFRNALLRPSPWAPRKSGGKHPLLIRSGTLRQSIRWRLNGTESVIVGTGMKYAPYHQMGTKKMPARPFFPFDRQGRIMPEMDRKILSTIERIYGQELEKLRR